MKKGIHPAYNKINVVMSDGKKVEMFSTSTKDLTLAVDNLNHPAWTGQRAQQDRGQRAEEFKKKFSGFKF